MSRSTHTFSTTPYFFDRGEHGTAQPLTERVNPHSRPIVSYYYPKGIGSHHYGERHPMKPHRLTLVNALVIGYGLDKQIHHIYDPPPATQEELEVYHDHDYIEFLKRVSVQPQNQNTMRDLIDRYNCTEDCPIFSDLFDFCKMSSGASLASARKLSAGATDIAINWAGGLHHAKRGEASGFCYTNDIVLAILELLRYHPRVLYIDIDIHHGDGVELAFYETDRVMTVSFHKYNGEFFPGTGKLDDNGSGRGKHFSINVPLLDGIDDDMYLTVFKTVIDDTVTAYRPSAIVLQCGADSLGCDRLGAFNLSIAAHGECVNFVRKYNVPLLIVGGGGYTIKNVSRCWTYETAVLVGASIPDELPATIYDSFFADSHWKLHPPLTGKVTNLNTMRSLQQITMNIRRKLRYLGGAPSVALQEIPPDLEGLLDGDQRNAEEKEEDLGAVQAGEHRVPPKVGATNDFYDGENDVDGDPVEPEVRQTAKTRRRGGGKAAKSKAPAAEDDDMNEATISAPRRAKGKGKGRKSGKGVEGLQDDPERSTPVTSERAPSTPMDVDEDA